MTIEFLRRHRHRAVVAAAWIVIIAGYQLWAWRAGLGPAESVRRLVEAIQGSPWGVVVYTVVYLARPLILFSATVLTVAGGFLFGPWLGLAVVVVASNGSAMVAYAIGRWFATGRVVRDGGTGRLAGYAKRMRVHSFETVLTMRLLLLPYDLVSYLAGFLRIRALPFLTGTAIGSVPGTIAFVLFGASIEEFDGGVPSLDLRILGASFALLVASLVLVRVVRRREGSLDVA